MAHSLSLAAISLLAGCERKGADPVGASSDDPLDTGPVRVDELAPLLERALAGTELADHASAMISAMEEIRGGLVTEAPAHAAVLTVTLNGLLLPLLTAGVPLLEAPGFDRAALTSALAAQHDAMAAGISWLDSLWSSLRGEVDLDGSHAAVAADTELRARIQSRHAALTPYLDQLDLRKRPSALAIVGFANRLSEEGWRGDSASLLSRCEELTAHLSASGTTSRMALEGDDCGLDTELLFWAAAIALFLSVIALVALIVPLIAGILGAPILAAVLLELELFNLSAFVLALLGLAASLIGGFSLIEEAEECACQTVKEH